MPKKVTLTVAEGFQCSDEKGNAIVSGKEYELTPRLDEYVRMGLLSVEGEPVETEDAGGSEPDGEATQPATMEEWEAHFAKFDHADLKGMAATAELEVRGNASKKALVTALAENEMAVAEEEAKAAEWRELYASQTPEELAARAQELGLELEENATVEQMVEALVDAELEGTE